MGRVADKVATFLKEGTNRANPNWVRRGICLCVGLVLTVLTHLPARAQQSLRVDPTGRGGQVSNVRDCWRSNRRAFRLSGFYPRLRHRQQEKLNTYTSRMSSCARFASPATRPSPRKN